MPAPHEKLATSLAALQNLQKGGKRVFQSEELSRTNRERLLQNGFLQEVMRGWLISTNPSARMGDSTPWYASFWEFCARYSEARFGAEWHLSPEQSLLLHAEYTIIPTQAIINSPHGRNNKTELLFGTSLYDLKQSKMPPAADLTIRGGLRLFVPEAALVKVSETFIARYPIEMRLALASIRDGSELIRRLLEGGHSVVSGRLAGAMREIGRTDLAGEISATMKSAGYAVRESEPLKHGGLNVVLQDGEPPIAGRLRTMWAAMRGSVKQAFPKAPGMPRNRSGYLRIIDEIYRTDAYHSLSIEGYMVTPELIELVRKGNWDPDHTEVDRDSRAALAARGYWQAFQVVKQNISEILGGAEPGNLVRKSHRQWYRELFQPCVMAGIIPPASLAGYRNDAVYLRGSRYVPPRWEAVRDAIPVLFDLIENESDASVRAVLGHWLFGYIHPYPDGNGRMARFLMNVMLASGGYKWTIIHVEDRAEYLAALDKASVEQDIVPFARFLAVRVAK